MCVATLFKELDKKGFDWEHGTILFQDCTDGPGYSFADEIFKTVKIEFDHEILHKEFSTDYGGAECPRFIAFDQKYMYFPGTYDGSTWVEKIYKDPMDYLGTKLPTPYVGGG